MRWGGKLNLQKYNLRPEEEDCDKLRTRKLGKVCADET